MCLCCGILLRRGRLYSCTVGRFIADSAASSCSSCATGTYRARPRHPPRVSLAPQVFRVLRRETLFYSSSSSSSFFNWVHLYEFSNELKKKKLSGRRERERERGREKISAQNTSPPISLVVSRRVSLSRQTRPLEPARVPLVRFLLRHFTHRFLGLVPFGYLLCCGREYMYELRCGQVPDIGRHSCSSSASGCVCV